MFIKWHYVGTNNVSLSDALYMVHVRLYVASAYIHSDTNTHTHTQIVSVDICSAACTKQLCDGADIRQLKTNTHKIQQLLLSVNVVWERCVKLLDYKCMQCIFVYIKSGYNKQDGRQPSKSKTLYDVDRNVWLTIYSRSGSSVMMDI